MPKMPPAPRHTPIHHAGLLYITTAKTKLCHLQQLIAAATAAADGDKIRQTMHGPRQLNCPVGEKSLWNGLPIMATKANMVETAVMTRSRATSSFRLRTTAYAGTVTRQQCHIAAHMCVTKHRETQTDLT